MLRRGLKSLDELDEVEEKERREEEEAGLQEQQARATTASSSRWALVRRPPERPPWQPPGLLRSRITIRLGPFAFFLGICGFRRWNCSRRPHN